jgi:hypothetical protein
VVLREEAGDDRHHAPFHPFGTLHGAPARLLDIDLAVLVGDDRPLRPAGFEEVRIDPRASRAPLNIRTEVRSPIETISARSASLASNFISRRR